MLLELYIRDVLVLVLWCITRFLQYLNFLESNSQIFFRITRFKKSASSCMSLVSSILLIKFNENYECLPLLVDHMRNEIMHPTIENKFFLIVNSQL